MSNDLEQAVSGSLDRRKFFKRAGVSGLGLAAMTMVGGTLSKLQAATTVTDADILNFALNLEYLEAEFYLMSTYGTTLQRSGVIKASDTTGPTTGGAMVNFSGVNYAFAASGLRTDEVAHVKLLRNALGSAAAKKPAINLDALGYGFGNVKDFLKLGRQFEDVGVSAYAGAAPAITNKTYLLTAAEIMATEAQHSLRFHSPGLHLVRRNQPGGRLARHSSHPGEAVLRGCECTLHCPHHHSGTEDRLRWRRSFRRLLSRRHERDH